jgi:hypothetical protein
VSASTQQRPRQAADAQARDERRSRPRRRRPRMTSTADGGPRRRSGELREAPRARRAAAATARARPAGWGRIQETATLPAPGTRSGARPAAAVLRARSGTRRRPRRTAPPRRARAGSRRSAAPAGRARRTASVPSATITPAPSNGRQLASWPTRPRRACLEERRPARPPAEVEQVVAARTGSARSVRRSRRREAPAGASSKWRRKPSSAKGHPCEDNTCRCDSCSTRYTGEAETEPGEQRGPAATQHVPREQEGAQRRAARSSRGTAGCR